MTRKRLVESTPVQIVRKDQANSSRRGLRSRRPLGLEMLEQRTVLANDLFIVPGVAGETYRLVFDWVSREAAFKNEIGVYQIDDALGRVDGLDPGAAGYSEAVARRSLNIFKDCEKPGDKSEITVNAGQRLGLILIQNGKMGAWQQQNPSNRVGAGPVAFFSFDAANPDRFDHVRASALTNNTQTFSFEDQLNGGDQDYNDAVIRVSLGRKDPLRTPGTTSQTVPTTFLLESRNDQPRGEVGVIVADDAGGRIGSLLPGQDGYVGAALARRQALFTPTQNGPATQSVNLPAASHLLYYIIDQGTAANFLQQNPTNRLGAGPLALFSSFAASPDGIDHVRFLSDNRIGFENSTDCEDKDYNDVVVTFTFGTPISNDAPPTVTARLINDSAGASGNNADRITNDPSTELTVIDTNALSNILVGIDNLPEASFVDVTSRRGTDGKILLDRAFINSLPGGSSLINQLSEGPHTIRVIATDATNLTTRFNFDFNFDSLTATPTAALDPASDTGTPGDSVTNLAQVIIRGTAEANALVSIVGGNIQATANSSGNYVLNNVPLNPGLNALVIRSTDIAGNVASVNLNVTRDSDLPSLAAQLANDTTGPGGTNSDRISRDPTINATATDNRTITSLRAALDPTTNTTLTDVLAQLQPNGSLVFTTTLLNQLAGGTLSQGAHTLRLVAGDAAGNSRTLDFTFTFDSEIANPTVSLDPASDTGTPDDRITNLPQVVLRGTASPGSLVEVVGQLIQATANDSGNYILTNVALTAGSNTLDVRSTDRAGNTASTSLVVTLDNALPAISAQLANDTGDSTETRADQITRDPTINANVTDVPAVTSLGIALDPLGNGTLTDVLNLLQSDGTIVFTQAQLNQLAGGTLSQGSHTLRIVAGDLAGNTRSVDFTFTFDSQIVKPTGSLDPSFDSGTIGDGITNFSPVTIRGTAEPGSLVFITGLTNPVLTDGLGNYVANGVPLASGLNTLVIRSTDGAGNTDSINLEIIRDSVRPSILAALANDTFGANGNNADRITSDPTINATITDNRAVTDLRAAIDPDNNTTLTSLLSQLQPDGTIVFTTSLLNQLAGGTLLQGPHTLTIFARDAANNFDRVDFTFTFDSVTTTPTIGIDPNFDTGQKGDLQTAITPIILIGSAEPLSLVSLVGTSRTTSASANGEFSFDNITLTVGNNPFIVRSTDLAGNVAQQAVNVVGLPALGDIELPTVSAQLVNDTAGPSGSSTDKITSDPRILVQAADNTGIVSLLVGLDNQTLNQYQQIASQLSSGSVTLSAEFLNQLAGGTLSQGPHVLRLIAADGADNSRSLNFSFTFDSVPASLVAGLAVDSDSGTVGDNITNQPLVTITGQTDPNASVQIVGVTPAVTADPSGVFSFTNVSLVLGANNFTVQSIDLAGNSTQTPLVITLIPMDVLAPTVSAQLAQDTAGPGGTTSDRITSNPTINASFTDDVGISAALVSLDGGLAIDVRNLLQPDGTIVFTRALLDQLAGGTLSQGSHTLQLVGTDPASNSNSVSLTFTFDSVTLTPTAALPAAFDSGTQGDLITNQLTVSITGNAEPGATVSIVGTGLSAVANGTGNYTLTNIALIEGNNLLTVRSTDSAGNSAQTDITIVRDSQGPSAVVGLSNDTAGPGGTNIDGLSSDPTITGTFTDSTSISSIRVGLDTMAVDQYLELIGQLTSGGALTVTPAILNQLAGGTLAQGPHLTKFIVRDVAGNQTNRDLAFAFDSVLANPNLSLDRASDGGVVGDNVTNLATITINGTADPNTQVRLIQTGETRDVGNDGIFSFTNVPLSLDNDGKNPLIVEVRDRAGNLSSRGIEIIRQNAAPTLVAPIANINRGPGSGSTPTQIAVDLADNFFDNDINNSLVRFNTNEGSFDMELFDAQAGRTVANFLNYVERGAYTNTFFHRRPNPIFVLQGGGFRLDGTAPSASVAPVAADPPVRNQFGPSNLAGTVAMAKLGTDPNSATNQFFVNLVDNVSLDTNNGGFSVFGRIVPETQPTINNLVAIPISNRGTPFNEIPLRNFPSNGTGSQLTPANLAFVNSVDVVRQVEKLTYTASVESTTNANLFTLTTNNRLIIALNPGQTGTATIRVTATDRAGASVSNTFTVTIA
jgi:cyclophilin family peptidyl-prolyl cis-trans isomerase